MESPCWRTQGLLNFVNHAREQTTSVLEMRALFRRMFWKNHNVSKMTTSEYLLTVSVVDIDHQPQQCQLQCVAKTWSRNSLTHRGTFPWVRRLAGGGRRRRSLSGRGRGRVQRYGGQGGGAWTQLATCPLPPTPSSLAASTVPPLLGNLRKIWFGD